MWGLEHIAKRATTILVLLTSLAACKSKPEGRPGTGSVLAAAGRGLPGAAQRPLPLVRAPQVKAPANGWPLLILLHGYGADPASVMERLGYDRLTARHPLVLVVPSGTLDRVSNRYWRASKACCDYFDDGIDDVGYLRALLTQLRARSEVDGRRVYVVGHSNGGHMAYRLACDASESIAAVVSVAGALLSAESCKPKRPLSLLHLQGDADEIVPYAPERLPRPAGRIVSYPGARGSVRLWAKRAKCSPRTEKLPAWRLEGNGLRHEAWVEREHYVDCPDGVEVALWTVRGGSHTSPVFVALADRVWQWLLKRRLHRAPSSR